MLAAFFQSAAEIQQLEDQVLMALPQPNEANRRGFYQVYCYNIFEASARSGYVLHAKRRFGVERYSGYEHAMTVHAGGASVAENAREFIFQKTAMSYEEIRKSPKYGPSRMYDKWMEWEKKRIVRPLLREVLTDDDSSGYETEAISSTAFYERTTPSSGSNVLQTVSSPGVISL
jgi:hypothetical protein